MKKNNRRWLLIIAGALAFGSIVSAAAVQQGILNQPLDGKVLTFAWPKEAGFFFDQIKLDLVVDTTKFSLVTRPGQMIYISQPAGDALGHFREYSFVAMPMISGKVGATRSEVLEIPPASREFRVRPFCLDQLTPASTNQSLDPLPAKPGVATGCQPRTRSGRLQDHVRAFEEKIGLKSGETYLDGLTGAHLTILDYGPSGFENAQEFNAFGKCCIEENGIEVCSCAVSTSSKSCSSDCQSN